MYEYFHVKVAANASILGRFSLDPEYRNIIDRAAEEGWRYVGFCLCRRRRMARSLNMTSSLSRRRNESDF